MSYEKLGAEIGRLVETKQAAYGDSFSKSGGVMRVLYPDGIPAEKLDDALTVVRVLDKLFRIATARDALGESPWRDVAGYALLSVKRVEGGTHPSRGERSSNEKAFIPLRADDCTRCGSPASLNLAGLCQFCFSILCDQSPPPPCTACRGCGSKTTILNAAGWCHTCATTSGRSRP